MKFELVEIITKDNLVHQGIYATPDKQDTTALLWVHGLTGKFYGDADLMNLVADRCGKEGMGFAAFNNRGHDIITGLRTVDPGEPSGYGHAMAGSGLEVFEDCVHDIDAAVGFLVEKGYTAVILVGHSTGANKACYYASTRQDDRVTGVVLAGPLSDRYSPKVDKERYEKNMTMFKMLIDEGKGDSLVTKANWFPATASRLWSLIAPHTSEDVFNYGDDTDVLSIFSKITKPMLVVLSGNDENADRPVETIRSVFDRHTKSSSYTSVIIPDATHGYEGKKDEFVNTVVGWATSVLPVR